MMGRRTADRFLGVPPVALGREAARDTVFAEFLEPGPSGEQHLAAEWSYEVAHRFGQAWTYRFTAEDLRRVQ